MLEAWLAVDHPELAIFDLAVSRHCPQEANAMPATETFGWYPLGMVAIAYHRYQFWVLSIVTYKLNAKGRIRGSS